MRRFFAATAVVVMAGVAALSWGTDGFRAFTSESARRLAVERAPRPLPQVALIDQDGVRLSLADYRGKVVLVEFIYTNCPTICGELGESFREVTEILRRMPRGRDVALLSVSFDPDRDDVAALKGYGDRFGATPDVWRLAVPADKDGLERMLRTFGVVVIPDAFGGFEHNAAVYVVDRENRIVRILDFAPPRRLADEALHRAAS